MERKAFKISFRTVLSVATVILVAYVVYQNWADIVDTFYHLDDTNVPVLLLLIPEQLFMYYACGQIFFSYLRRKYHKHFEKREMLKIATELNFVNHAVPAGGIGGLAYLTYRLHQYKITAGQASFLYLFRYAVTTVVNYFQALVAVGVLALMGAIPAEAHWIIWVAMFMNMAVFFVLGLVIFIASSKKRIDKFAKIISTTTDWLARTFTFGKVHHMIKAKRIQDYFGDIHNCVAIVRQDKKSLRIPALWGLIYSFCEVTTYWIVACSLGRPELLPFIMVGEAIGSVFDGIVPYGLYELGMAGVMIALSVDFSTATIITVMTRVFTLIFTIATGYYPYNKAIRRKANA